jgi:hypothetical protein
MKKQSLEQIEASLSRWKTRLRRAMTAIDKLEKQRKRLVSRGLRAGAQSSPPAPRAPVPVDLAIAPPLAKPVPPKPSNGTEKINMPTADEIPSFLRRSPDPIAEAIKAGQAETKRLKAKGRIAKMKAKQAGDLKKMPLTGNAALAAIRG